LNTFERHLDFQVAKLMAGHDARLQQRSKQDRISVIYYGQDVLPVAPHIAMAQLERGAPPVLSKRAGPEPDRSWYRNLPACKGKTGGITGMECDEYPFASTDQGGRFAGKGLFIGMGVSVMPVPAGANNSAGIKLKKFYMECGITPADPRKSWFAVIPMPALSRTEWQCAR
jgi:hypothetical protein